MAGQGPTVRIIREHRWWSFSYGDKLLGALGGDTFCQSLRKHYRLFNLAMAALLIYTAVAGLLSHK